MVIQKNCVWNKSFALGSSYLLTLQRHYLYLWIEKRQLLGIASNCILLMSVKNYDHSTWNRKSFCINSKKQLNSKQFITNNEIKNWVVQSSAQTKKSFDKKRRLHDDNEAYLLIVKTQFTIISGSFSSNFEQQWKFKLADVKNSPYRGNKTSGMLWLPDRCNLAKYCKTCINFYDVKFLSFMFNGILTLPARAFP